MAQGLLSNRPMANGAPSAAGLLASYGRGGDTTLAHLTPGEIVVPLSAQTPELHRALVMALLGTGHDPSRYVVGGADDSRNPNTGLLEYYDAGDGMGGAETGGDNQGGIGGATGPDFGGGPGPQGGGGQIADLNRQDQIGLGYNPNDLAETPDFGQRVGYFLDTIPDRISHGVRDMVNNPGRTLANLAFNMVAPGLPSLINTGVGLIDPNMTFGGVATRGLQAMTDYAPTPASYTEADKNTDNGKPNARDDGGYPGSYGGGDGPAGTVANQTGLPAGQVQQTPEQVAQQALREVTIKPPPPNYWTNPNIFNIGTTAGKPAGYNWWTGNQFHYPTGLLGVG